MFLTLIASLHGNPQMGEPGWWELHQFEQAYSDRGIDLYYKEGNIRRAKIGRAQDILKEFEEGIEKEVDDWFSQTKGIDRQASIRQWRKDQEAYYDSAEGQQELYNDEYDRDGNLKICSSVWGYVDPEYLVKLDRTIAENRKKYERLPLFIPLLTPLLFKLSNRYYHDFMFRVTMHKTYLSWLDEREAYSKDLEEWKASVKAMQERHRQRFQSNSKTVADDGWL